MAAVTVENSSRLIRIRLLTQFCLNFHWHIGQEPGDFALGCFAAPSAENAGKAYPVVGRFVA
jgi:hypothetical protein